MKLYSHELSGNCHKVRLLLSLLKTDYELVPVDFIKGEHKSPQFLKLNPLGQVPVLINGDVVIRDSQASLVYLARLHQREDWLPVEAEPLSQVMQWLSTAANDIQEGLSAVRRYYLLNAQLDVELATKQAHVILKIIDQHLTGRQWLELNRPTVADVACFPYVALARDGKIALDAYPNVVAWIERMKQLPGYVGMPGL